MSSKKFIQKSKSAITKQNRIKEHNELLSSQILSDQLLQEKIPTLVSEIPATKNTLTVKADNPFLPKHVLKKLATSQTETSRNLQMLFNQNDEQDTWKALEEQARNKANVIIDSIIADQIPVIADQLRFQLQNITAKTLLAQNCETKD